MSDRPNGHKTFDELWGKAALENHLKEHGWKYAAPEQQTLCEGLAFAIERYRKRIPLLILGGILFGNFNAILAYPLYFILNEVVVPFTHSCWKDGIWKRQKCFYVVDVSTLLLILLYIFIPPITSWFK